MFIGPRADDGDRSPWGDFWFKPVPYKGGGDVSPDSALQLTAVYACVRILSEGVASLPFQLRYPKDGGRGWTYDEKHWLYRLFARRPNEYQNPFEFREMMQGHLSLRGNAYARIVGNSDGSVTDLLPIHPDAVKVEMLDNGGWRYRIKQPAGADEILRRDQVFHVRGLSTDGVMGINPIAAARGALSLGLAAQSYGERFFQNDGTPRRLDRTPRHVQGCRAEKEFPRRVAIVAVRREPRQNGGARVRDEVSRGRPDERRRAIPRNARVPDVRNRPAFPRAAAPDRRPVESDVQQHRTAEHRLRDAHPDPVAGALGTGHRVHVPRPRGRPGGRRRIPDARTAARRHGGAGELLRPASSTAG
jgi:hypothetical protein